MTTLALTYTKLQKKVQSRIDSVEIPKINWKTVCLTGFFAAAVLLVFYVWQVNDLTAGSYLINNYQNQISKLSRENKNLEISFAESSFLGQALTKIQAMNFQKTTSVQYIQIPDNSVAVIQGNNMR